MIHIALTHGYKLESFFNKIQSSMTIIVNHGTYDWMMGSYPHSNMHGELFNAIIQVVIIQC